MKTMQVHAHRGASAYAPENTLPAFELAIQMGADGFETDVHLTADGIYAVSHDGKLGRCCNGTGNIEEMTLAQIRRFDFGAWFAPAFAGTAIPTLDELLDTAGWMDVVNIELKGPLPAGADVDAALDTLYETIGRHGCLPRAIVSTFEHVLGARLKERHPDLRLGLLYSDRLSVEETLALAARHRADAIHPLLGSLTPEIVTACHENGIAVNVWTVDAPADIQRAIGLQVDGIITNVPDKVLAALGRGGAQPAF